MNTMPAANVAPWVPAVDVGPLDLVGPWYWGTYAYGMRLTADGLLHLLPLLGAGRGSRFRPTGEGSWIGLDGYHADEVLTERQKQVLLEIYESFRKENAVAEAASGSAMSAPAQKLAPLEDANFQNWLEII